MKSPQMQTCDRTHRLAGGPCLPGHQLRKQPLVLCEFLKSSLLHDQRPART